jgi:hypothetical protein
MNSPGQIFPKGKKGKNQNLICPDEAEAQAAAGVARIVPAAVGTPKEPGIIVPAAATAHAIGTARGYQRIIPCMSGICIFIVNILAPLSDIAAHIIYTKAVGGFCTHPVGFVPAVAVIPCNTVQIISTGILLIFSLASGCIFPLGFRGQGKTCAGPLVKLGNKRFRIIPGHLLNRIIIP